MPQPTPYARQFDFSDFAAGNPGKQPPGVQLDAEFDALKQTIDAIRDNLELVQRDDGGLKNGIVTNDSIHASFRAMLVREAMRSGAPYAVVEDYPAIDPTGVADSTAGLLALLGAGHRNVYIKEGTYRIANAGPNTGGVEVVITNSLRVLCSPDAKFVADGLDNDIFRFSVPSNGAGVPADGIGFEWIGGLIDQRGQKVSTSVPYGVEYPAPAGKQGASATCDGISLRFAYTSGGVVRSGANAAFIGGVSFIAGAHWQSAGGDSCIYIGEGTATSTVERCTFVGSRDVAIYGSRDATGAQGRNLIVRGNDFRNCFYGATAKRGFKRFVVQGNTFTNCVTGALANVIAGVDLAVEGVLINGNTFDGCSVSVRLDYARGPSIRDNDIRNVGARLENGDPFPNILAYGVTLAGCVYATVEGNTFEGASPGFIAANIQAVYLTAYTVGGVSVPTTFATVARNPVIGLRNIGLEDLGANDNIFDSNPHVGTAIAGPTTIGSRTTQLRAYDATTSGPRYFVGGTEIYRASPTTFRLLVPLDMPALPNFANDAAAAAGGVAIRGLYRNGSVVMQRVV